MQATRKAAFISYLDGPTLDAVMSDKAHRERLWANLLDAQPATLDMLRKLAAAALEHVKGRQDPPSS